MNRFVSPSASVRQITITVVVPAYNRPHVLTRALASLSTQSLVEFECIVVDGSEMPLEPIVAGFDERFQYVRSRINGGPYSARITGFEHARGRYVFLLDSDLETLPWALERAVSLLDGTPEVDGVAGLHLWHEESRCRVRVRDGRRVVTPDEYRSQEPIPDCVAAVRRSVVEEWLQKRRDYYALEVHQWLTFSLRHNQLYVDEPWARLYTSAPGRLSDRARAADTRRMRLDDYVIFMDEHEELMAEPCVTLDRVLQNAWLSLMRRGRRSDAARAAAYLRHRGAPVTRALRARLFERARRTVGAVIAHEPPITWI